MTLPTPAAHGGAACRAPRFTAFVKWPRNWHPELPRGAFCAVVHADAESAYEKGRRARRRRFSG
eukprot:15461407-Alexandrium_andersonii.AAC.1